MQGTHIQVRTLKGVKVRARNLIRNLPLLEFIKKLISIRLPKDRRRQRGRVVCAPYLKSGGLAGVVARQPRVQLLDHACKMSAGLPPTSRDF